VSSTLLLADDSVTIQRVIELTFADEDVRVVAVGTGREAIAILDRTPPDIVLADVGMPDQNGYEVARHIKGTPRLAHIPVVLLTGAFEPIDQARVAEVGCDGVLQKPFEPQLVIARVKQLLAQSRDVHVEPWAPPVEEERPEPETAGAFPSQAPGDMDSYFDRLDAALSNLADAPQPRSSPVSAPPLATADVDWFDSSALGAPTAVMSDRDDVSSHLEPEPSHSPPSPHTEIHASLVIPPLADVFAALLAAEQSAPGRAEPAVRVAWPTGPVTAVPADIVETVTRRVLHQLSDRVVRETVAERVSAIAERLVREEIARIKKSME
jgi:CheY-like chemotaxis protein